MAKINFSTFPTIQAINNALEENQDTQFRPYLGMSQIGHPCERALWYSFRWAARRHIKAKGLKAIEDGHSGEDLMAQRLRLIPTIELHTHDASGNQFGFTAIGGHFKGHMDGAIKGIFEAPQTWHVWEHKQTNEKKFNALQKAIINHGEKQALKHWDEIYYAQAVCYMEMTGMERHFLTCSTPGGRDQISVRTNSNPKFAKQLFEKAERIIFASTPPERLSSDPAWYQCKWCDYHDICHGTAAPLPNCRTCAHATPAREGGWKCARHGQTLTPSAQEAACDSHRYIPATLANFTDPVDADQADNWVRYTNKLTGETFTNGAHPDGFTSAEIHDCEDKKLLADDDKGLQILREKFGGMVSE